MDISILYVRFSICDVPVLWEHTEFYAMLEECHTDYSLSMVWQVVFWM